MVNTILTDDERPKLPTSEYSLAFYDEGGVQTLDAAAYTEQDMEAYADAREAAVLAKLREQEPVAEVVAFLSTDRSGRKYLCFAPKDDEVSQPLYAAPQPAVVQVDRLAQIIRTVDGSHTLGAAALAEKIVEALAAPEAPATAVVQVPQDVAHVGQGLVDVWKSRAAPAAPALPAEVREAIKVARKDREALTVVYRNPTKEEVQQAMRHPKAVWLGWCHAPYERDAALARIDALGGGE